MTRGCPEAGDDTNVGLGRSPGVGLIVHEIEEAEFASLNVMLLCAWMHHREYAMRLDAPTGEFTMTEAEKT